VDWNPNSKKDKVPVRRSADVTGKSQSRMQDNRTGSGKVINEVGIVKTMVRALLELG
jgi:hypothetical protein